MNTENQTTLDLMTELHPRRDFKSRMFIMIYRDKKRLLNLYNAISGRRYTDPEQLTITTLENAIYMSMKNDVSFLIGMRLSLYEHQSLLSSITVWMSALTTRFTDSLIPSSYRKSQYVWSFL